MTMLTDASRTVSENPTPGELVARLVGLRSQKQSWYEAGLKLDEEINQAEKAIHEAVAFLRNAIDDGEARRAF